MQTGGSACSGAIAVRKTGSAPMQLQCVGQAHWPDRSHESALRECTFNHLQESP